MQDIMIDRSPAVEIRSRRLSYLSPARLDSIYDCLDEILGSEIPGDFTEFGVALGGSGICLARALKGDRRYFGFDVFGMIPPPSAIDGETVQARYDIIASGKSKGIGGDEYYGYVDDLYGKVCENFKSFNCDVDNKRICLVKGYFNETLTKHNGLDISFAHIDCDWYEPVSSCLKYVWPRLSAGGFIVLDDYNDWEGCKKATDDFVADNKDAKFLRSMPHAVLQKPYKRHSTFSLLNIFKIMRKSIS